MSTEPAAEPIPPEVERLFWDIEPGTLRLDAHRDYVMARVMARGGWAAMQWLRRTYTGAELADFLQRRGAQLAPRERAYWAVIACVDVAADPGGGRPGWAGA